MYSFMHQQRNIFFKEMVDLKYTYYNANRKRRKEGPYPLLNKWLQNHVTDNKNPLTVISNKNSFSS